MASVNSFPANLLVVGNEPGATHPFHQWLEPFAVKYVPSSEQVLQDIHQSTPDLVLLNPTLNGTGLQVCSTIKGDESLGFVPILVLMAKESGPTEAAFESGADEVLVEPIQKAELLA